MARRRRLDQDMPSPPRDPLRGHNGKHLASSAVILVSMSLFAFAMKQLSGGLQNTQSPRRIRSYQKNNGTGNQLSKAYTESSLLLARLKQDRMK